MYIYMIIEKKIIILGYSIFFIKNLLYTDIYIICFIKIFHIEKT